MLQMKKYIIYIGILGLGLLLGKFLFGNGSSIKKHEHKEQLSSKHWTCSMHPQIDLFETGLCPICGMELVPKIDSKEGLSINQFKMSKNTMVLANIETVIVGNNLSASKVLTLSGKISENNKANAVQTAHFGGRIEKLNFKSAGEYVSKGALIASIYSPELVTAQNELIEAMSIKESQPELYKAVRNKLKYWKVSEKQIQDIEYNKKVLTNFNMYANVSGYISKIFIEEGNHVKEGTPLFNVSNLGSVWANFDVYEQDINKLKLGQAIVISLNAYSDKTINTKIDYIAPVLNNSTRTIAVRATLQNNNQLLKPGMLITSVLKIDSSTQKNQRIILPKSAVMWTGRRSVVYIKASKTEPIFELREVSLGNDLGDNYEVLQGIVSGDEIVSNGTFTVDAAAQLQGKASMMNRSIDNVESHKNHQSNKKGYQCPMDCEQGKVYEESGSCQVCKMDLIKKEDKAYKEDQNHN